MKTTVPVVSAIALLSLSSSLSAEAPAYKVATSFGGEDMKTPPVCVSMDKQDQLYVLLEDGTVVAYNTDGKKTGGFKADMKTPPTTMTVADGKIYLFNPLTATKTVTIQGKKVKRVVPSGIGCSVYDAAGAKVADLQLPEAASATDAHFIGKELAVGDYNQQQIVCYDLAGTEGKVTRKITKVFRLCCGIFDFCPGGEPDTLIAANLGAFKVQVFKAGDKISEFGQRGEKPEEFRGCCNPVNIAILADGAIVTVEKDPTRVKIYDQEHKTCAKVTGLTELVQGCSTIPIAVDSKGALYLASRTKQCIVKCVPGVADKPEPPEPKQPAIPEMSAGMKEIMEKVFPLLAAKDYTKAMTEAEAITKAHAEMTEDEKAQILLSIGLTPHMEKGDVDAALKQIDTIAQAHPASQMAKQADAIKVSIKESMERMKSIKKNGEGGDDETEVNTPEPMPSGKTE